MRIGHTINSLGIKAGGTSTVVPRVCDAVVSNDTEVLLLSRDAKTFGPPILPSDSRVTCRVVKDDAQGYATAIRNLVQSLDILHDHGFWLKSNRLAAHESKKAKIPLVVTPHGMLLSWPLRHKRCRKLAAWHAFGKRLLNQADLVHATAIMEAEELRSLGVTSPIAVIPFGVDDLGIQPQPQQRPRRVVFMSRVNPKKGLEELLHAWKQLQSADWELIIAGPDEAGYESKMKKLAQSLSLGPGVKFVGPVFDQAKDDLLASASVFVLPTHSENFGAVIPEALTCQVPVITTVHAPWQDLQTHRCGWWIESGVDQLISALSESMALSQEQRSAMGLRGKEMIETHYSWKAFSLKMNNSYGWLTGSADRPECLVG